MKNELITKIENQLASNTAGNITAQDLRDVLIEVVRKAWLPEQIGVSTRIIGTGSVVNKADFPTIRIPENTDWLLVEYVANKITRWYYVSVKKLLIERYKFVYGTTWNLVSSSAYTVAEDNIFIYFRWAEDRSNKNLVFSPSGNHTSTVYLLG